MEEKKDYWEQWLTNSKEKVKATIVLTDEQVAEIRKDPFKYSAVKWAKNFNCSKSVINNVIQNRGAYYSPDYSFTWVDGKEDNRTLVERLKERQSQKENLSTRDKGKWLTEEQVDFIRESKLSNIELAKMFNCNRGTISNIINNHVYYDPNYTPIKKIKRVHLDNSQIESIKKNTFISNGEYAKIFNTTATFINNLRKDLIKKYKTGVKVKSDFRSSKIDKRFTPEQIKYIRESNLANKKIAKELKCGSGLISQIRSNKLYYNPNYQPKVRWQPKLTMEDAKAIRDSELTIIELSKKYNISKNHIWDILSNKYFKDENYIPKKRVNISKGRKLTDEQVIFIRTTDKFYKDVCEELGVSESTFYNIRNNNTYKNVKIKNTGEAIFDKKQIEELQANPLNRINMLWGK